MRNAEIRTIGLWLIFLVMDFLLLTKREMFYYALHIDFDQLDFLFRFLRDLGLIV